MKYIRTKDGRILDFDIINSTAEHYCFDNKNQLYIEWYAVIETVEIIKQADAIPELCDYVVIKNKHVELPDIKNLDEMNKKAELHNPPAEYIDNLKFLIEEKLVDYIKFAILTDKGIIYVAEMNDKGEIKLL